MSGIRYFISLLISLSIFGVISYALLSLIEEKKLLKNTASSVIKIAMINPVKKSHTKKVSAPPPTVTAPQKVVAMAKPVTKKVTKRVVKKITKKVVKKSKPKPKKRPIVHKKKPKKVIKKHVKKVVKKVVKKPKYVAHKVVETVVQEPYYAPVSRVVVPAPVVKPVPKVIKAQPAMVAKPAGDNGRAKKAFLRNVRSRIIANKKYPKMALRRHVEGSVKIRFDITREGQVSNIRFINGKSIFHKSIRKTLERTFPVGIPSAMRGKLPISDVSVILHFNIN